MTQRLHVTGYPLAAQNTILRTLAGSTVHGTQVGASDTDEIGVFIPRAVDTLATWADRASRADTSVIRTVPEGAPSGPGDVEHVLYSLPKFLHLAMGGNPSLLVALFAPGWAITKASPLGHELLALAPSIVSWKAPPRFLGYLRAQRHRTVGQGTRLSHVPKRPHLVEQYGFDTKYASQAVRLGLQGLEVVAHGRLHLPMPEPARETVVAVRTGQVSFAETLDLIDSIADALALAIDTSDGGRRGPLRQHPDAAAVNAWMVGAHRRWWGWGGQSWAA